MARLEYRLYSEQGDTFPLLYYYERVGRDETALRFACDYFVKDGTVYEKTSAAVESSCYVVYVKEAEDERTMPWGKPLAAGRRGVVMELREYAEGTADYPLIHTFSFADTLEAMLHLQANYLYVNDREWYRTSTEIDEDRETYVYYAVPV
ncbi:hypothetical protein PAESOLCIP111_00618 [Paenibacillus solanacearum]|uniref:Uncharacterized protein n=1 Tax=Paenibacillus solanacearum TaxID=2048548 RepID=A0A916NM59_9BACL|nr:hypothetical protein [Paenibacillus solanacearum]CAG7603651.1 hypothetical protein PAESOLCIP111_00618 [Paenibacillus solanacearum]